MVNNICKEFRVNETWLRTGSGDMFREVSREDEISEFVERVLTDETAGFKRRFIAALSKLDPDGWNALEELVENTARQHAAEPLDQRAVWEREADEFAALAREQFLLEKKRESQASSAKGSGGVA